MPGRQQYQPMAVIIMPALVVSHGPSSGGDMNRKARWVYHYSLYFQFIITGFIMGGLLWVQG